MSQPIAYILLEAPVTLNERALVDSVRQRHPDLPWDFAAGAAEAEAKGALLIRCGRGTMVTVMQLQAPLPHDENLWARAAMIWPEARVAAGRHRAFLTVALMGTSENKVEGARLITAVVGGLIALTSGCCAAIWEGLVARSPQLWLNESRRAFAPFPDCPFTLWIEIIPFLSGQTIGAVTVGLSFFAGREIEFEVDGMDHATVITRVAGLASYLLEHGPVVKDGDTIGISETDRIKVNHGVSRFHGSPVFAVRDDVAVMGQWTQYPIIPLAIARNHPVLIMLSRVGLFDPSGPDNQARLPPNAYASEDRLEAYDQGIAGWLSKVLETEAYVEADKKARQALSQGDVETAKSALMPFAEKIRELLMIAFCALTTGHLFMFPPK